MSNYSFWLCGLWLRGLFLYGWGEVHEGHVALEGEFPAQNKFPMNLVRQNKGKGKKLGIKGVYSHSSDSLQLYQRLSQLLLSSCGSCSEHQVPGSLLYSWELPPARHCLLPAAPDTGRNSVGASLVTGGCLTNYVVGTEARTEWVLLLHPYPGSSVL